MIFPKLLRYIIPAFLLLFSCQQSKQKEKHSTVVTSPPTSDSLHFVVKLNQLRLRKEAGTQAEVIKTLAQGSLVFDLGEVSPFVTEIQLGGKTYLEPWIKVRTTDGKVGWVFVGALKHDAVSTKILRDKKVQALFGKSIKKKIRDYQNKINTIQTAKDFQIAFDVGELLRDSIVELLGQKLSPNSKGEMPNMFWLKDLMPAYVPALIAEGTRYYLFQDYKTFHEIAAKTSTKDDDAFIDLCTYVHDVDSIEYFFPSWVVQVSDIEGYSLLGSGKHFGTLKKINELSMAHSIFSKRIELIKQDLIDDVTSKGMSYWEPKEKIIKELKQILNSNFKILSQADRVALKTRLKQFANPKANAIQVNLRAGMEELEKS